MNKTTMTEVVKAIMITADLEPDFEHDYYQSAGATQIKTFCEGACAYFNLSRDHWMFHFSNLDYLDSPSETIKFFINNIGK